MFVCSATPHCCSHLQIPFSGHFLPPQKVIELRCILGIVGLPNPRHSRVLPFGRRTTGSCNCSLISRAEESVSSINCVHIHSSTTSTVNDLNCGTLDKWRYPLGNISQAISTGNEELATLASSRVSTNAAILESSISTSGSLDMDNGPLSNKDANVHGFLSGINESIGASIHKAEASALGFSDTINTSVTSAIKVANEAVDEVFSVVDQAKVLTGNGLQSFSSDLKEVSGKAGYVALDVLRKTLVAAADSFTNGATFVVDSYGSAKKFLPPDIQTSFDLSEEQAIKILRPFGEALQQVYVGIEGLERGLGLDPDDPIVPVILLLGASFSLWYIYKVVNYGGYSGDLSPKSTLELLSGKENVVLIDVRPEVLRERDGVPDLRRAARYRYAGVTLPQLDGSLRKLLKSERGLDDALVAIIIQNLKMVQGISQVIIMDADGTRSKSIARSVRKLGIKKSYLVQGGFQSWVTQGLRVKELKPETTLTILNEEAEAILEDMSLSPLGYITYGAGLVAAVYALSEWEKALQFIGILGLAQTLYWRISSYEDSEELKQDLRRLVAPVTLGAQAVTWAAGKLESSRNGLPTSPSLPDVRNRVMQAAARHESQPSDIEEFRDPATGPAAPTVNENVDLSDA